MTFLEDEQGISMRELINLYLDIILAPRLTLSPIIFMFNLDEKRVKLASFGLNYAHVVVLRIFRSFC